MPRLPTFAARLDILPPAQRRLWDELGSLPESFMLYGGTALALRLGHRQSIDFDFFSNTAIDPQGLLASLPLLADAAVTQIMPNTLSVTVNRDGPVRLSFFGVPTLKRVGSPEAAKGYEVKVASLLDLAGTKVAVVQQRAETKDYVDIDAILASGEVSLPMALAAGRTVYGVRFNPQIALKALSFFGEPSLARLPSDLQDRLRTAVRDVDLDCLPSIPPYTVAE